MDVWGSYGTAPGKFGQSIRKAATDAAGNVYVTDGGDCVGQQGCVVNDRVQKFSPTGTLLGSWGGTGSGNGQFHTPFGLDVAPNGAIYVADFSNGRVQQLSASGQYVRQWPSSAWDVAIDSAGNVFTAGNDGVREYDATGQLLGTLATAAYFAIAIDDQDNVYALTDSAACGNCNRVVKFDATGTSLGTIVKGGVADGHLATTNDIDVAGDSLYTVDNGDPTGRDIWRAQRFDLSGDFIVRTRLELFPGNGSGLTAVPQGIAAHGDFVYLPSLITQGAGTYGRELVVRFDTNVAEAIMDAPIFPEHYTDEGFQFEFDGARSWAPLARIVNYRWDLDGDGTFERDTGSVPHVTRAYATPGDRHVKLRVTAEGGDTATYDAYTVMMRTRPPAGPVGVSINNGDEFTNDPHVTLHLVWPRFAKDVFASNDGGFANAGRFAVDEGVPWTLRSTNAERLPKTVYVRFDDSTETFQDDIILDTTDPVVTSADVVPSTGLAALRAAANRRKNYVIHVKATDKLSGVARVQVANEHKAVIARVRYKRKFTVSAFKKPRWVRVRDRAGNLSKWRKLSAPKA